MLMNNDAANKKVHSKINFEWLFQLIASISWLISVFVYGSYEFGDCLQLVAASAWTVANVMSFFNQRKMSESKEESALL